MNSNKTITPPVTKYKSLFDELTELGFTYRQDDHILEIYRAGDEKPCLRCGMYTSPEQIRRIIKQMGNPCQLAQDYLEEHQ